MGKRSKEDLERQRVYAAMADHIYKKGIFYQAQAERLGLDRRKYQFLRTDERYIVSEADLLHLKGEFLDELEDFGQPIAIDEELSRLRAELAALREKVGKKESLNEQLQELLIEAQRRIKELGG